ncbi:hypothetical protein P280DRAFT_545492 [Massarina eburnea CBS 473.64]|uniref:Zinc finger PHD-type domain-containing protein n=1 Tax=Massarina eburnea CBS 473.64 TaxID=1395130 RepID=A0A6A6SGG9_9PLEO|nr:hypothetical protein P280DRAFT_545492 [Massarina eburnea CBS 473.64]
MVGPDILFRWEDSHALHHCGFCERPLSHPGAKTSCFGPHSEPCCRFHQAMFMKNKSHTCIMCNNADEAHSKRHNEIADRLRNIYDTCGEDWTIIPAYEPERGRSRIRSNYDPDGGDNGDNGGDGGDGDGPLGPSAGSTLSKKERKEQKRLERAASRPRFVTLEDRIHIGLVLHAADRQDSAAGPDTTEQLAEIEKNLRYNAQVYNEGEKRSALKELSKITDADIDFEGEMSRILEAFRITELLNRNTKNKGLRGKILREFDRLVVEFKELVVDDLLLLKKEELEIRMRRAAYLRYTNRASFDIVRSRYKEKDWRTGEKYWSPTSDDSQPPSSVSTLEGHNNDGGAAENALDALSTPLTPVKADTRHVHRGYKKLGEDGQFENVTPASNKSSIGVHGRSFSDLHELSSKPHTTASPQKPTPSVASQKLMILSIKAPNPSGKQTLARTTRQPATLEGKNVWQVATKKNAKSIASSKPPVPPPWQKKSPSPETYTWPSPSVRSTPLRPFDVVGSPNSNSHITPNTSPAHEIDSEKREPAPVKPVSMPTATLAPTQVPPIATGEAKKAKKKKREAERKARRTAEEQASLSTAPPTDDQPRTPDLNGEGFSSPDISGAYMLDDDTGSQYDPGLTSPDSATQSGGDVPSSPPSTPLTTTPFGIKNDPFKHLKPAKAVAIKTKCPIESPSQGVVSSTPAIMVKPIKPSQPTGPRVIKHARHIDWTHYGEEFYVDGLTDPKHQRGCSMYDSCRYEDRGTIDCPIHDHAPYCSCHDPLAHACHIVYPSKENRGIGPFNRLRAKKLLAFFNKDPEANGKLMIIDDSIKEWITIDGCDRTMDKLILPSSLKREIDSYELGYLKGRLMLQTEEYRALRYLNGTSNHPITERKLVELVEACEPPIPEDHLMCYCADDLPAKEKFEGHSKGLITCSHAHCNLRVFHRECVKNFGIDRVSKWYCFRCYLQMSDNANRVLQDLECMRKGEKLPGWKAIENEILEM